MKNWSLVLAAAFAVVPAAQATTYGIGSDGKMVWEQIRFYEPGSKATSQYPNGQPTYYGSTSDKCAGADRCGEPMLFDTKFGGQLTATAEDVSSKTNGIVIQDLDPDYGGLGVLSRTSTGGFTGLDDINGGDTLTLTFANTVRIVGFHFWDKDHSTYGSNNDDLNSGDKFGLSVDGSATQQMGFGNNFPWYGPSSMLVGKSFTFSYVNEDFYLGAVKVAQVAEVPEPATYALTLGGLLALGFMARRRRG